MGGIWLASTSTADQIWEAIEMGFFASIRSLKVPDACQSELPLWWRLIFHTFAQDSIPIGTCLPRLNANSYTYASISGTQVNGTLEPTRIELIKDYMCFVSNEIDMIWRGKIYRLIESTIHTSVRMTFICIARARSIIIICWFCQMHSQLLNAWMNFSGDFFISLKSQFWHQFLWHVKFTSDAIWLAEI